MLHRYAPNAGNVTLIRSPASIHPSIHLSQNCDPLCVSGQQRRLDTLILSPRPFPKILLAFLLVLLLTPSIPRPHTLAMRFLPRFTATPTARASFLAAFVPVLTALACKLDFGQLRLATETAQDDVRVGRRRIEDEELMFREDPGQND